MWNWWFNNYLQSLRSWNNEERWESCQWLQAWSTKDVSCTVNDEHWKSMSRSWSCKIK